MLKHFWRNAIIIALFCLIAIIGTVNYWVIRTTAKQIYSDVKLIPENRVGLLLGTSKYQDKARHIINPYYQNRIDAAVALYMAGKIDYIIVSGDSSLFYNEPELMKNDLIARGVPAERIYADNAGLRTLDSILRCHDVFGIDQITIISQHFHNERAVFIANHKNITAIAFDAKDGDTYWQVRIRESLARVKMVYDLLFNTQAKYYGEKVEIK
jgi:SanA protein